MIKKALLIAFLFILFQSCHVGRFFIYNFADARDYKKFPKKELHHSDTPFFFSDGSQTQSLHLPKTVKIGHRSRSFEKTLKRTGTLAFIIIRNDSILYQWYRPGKNRSSIATSFSMSKSFISALIGIAIDDGFIKSADDPIVTYLDFLDKKEFAHVTIQHVLDMRSGIKFNEDYFNPFGDIAKYYYGTNLKKYLNNLEMESEPGKKFSYISLNTQLLGLILEKATGKSLTAYLQEKLWSPLGMEFDASWSIDSKKNKTEKAFCCLNARAVDFAKLGRLYVNNGNWSGKQLVSEKWVNASNSFTEPKNGFAYSNHWWHTRDLLSVEDSNKVEKPYQILINPKTNQPYLRKPSGDFYAQGLLGQYLYVYPEKKIIIVRLSKREGRLSWPNLFKDIARKN